MLLRSQLFFILTFLTSLLAIGLQNQQAQAKPVSLRGDVQQASLLSLNRPVACSSTETGTTPTPCGNAVDGNGTTRWASAFADPQWIYVDLGASKTISRVLLTWEAAYATAFQIQTSNDAATWTTIQTVTGNSALTNDLAVSASGRYVRVYGTARATVYGYSLWEFSVYGEGGVPVTPTVTRTPGSGIIYKCYNHVSV